VSQTTKQTHTAAKNKLIGWFVPIVFTLIVATCINKGAIYWFNFEWSTLLDMVNYFSVYILATVCVRKYNSNHQSPTEQYEAHPAYNWPLPAPIGKLGKFAPIFTYYPSTLLSILNPFLLCQQIRQLIGQGATSIRLNQNQDYAAQFQSKVEYRLPFDNEWLVYQGGHTPETSHSWDILTQRYAYDFVMADSHFSRHQAKGNRVKDYFCYRKEILAAASGEVVKVVDGLSDGFCVGYFVVDFLAREMAGNHIIIKHAEGEYGFYAHLLANTIAPQVGDKVSQGQVIGLCGFSGNGTEPHLHFHLQDAENFYYALGLPIKFSHLDIDGHPATTPSIIKRGSRVTYYQRA